MVGWILVKWKTDCPSPFRVIKSLEIAFLYKYIYICIILRIYTSR